MDELDIFSPEPQSELSARVADLSVISQCLTEGHDPEMRERLLKAADIVLLHMAVLTHPTHPVMQ